MKAVRPTLPILIQKHCMKRIFLLYGTLLCLCSPVLSQVSFRVHLDPSIKRSLTGRLFVYTTTDTTKGVPNEPNYSQPMFAMQVTGWTNKQVIEVNDKAEAFSLKPSQMKPGYYKAVGIIDANKEERGAFNPGNVYSAKNVLFRIPEDRKAVVDIYLNNEVRERPFPESDTIKLVRLRSDLLSTFHHKDVFIKAGVVLPKEYLTSPDKNFPVVFVIPGWGGNHYNALSQSQRMRYGVGMGLPKIFVFLNPETQTPWGLHAFVDSKVNGPWGKALVEEMIPYIRKNFRGATETNKTFVIGQSSGGYPSLWLLLNYPKVFGGGWAVSPDPVDFSAFTGVNLYQKNANFYRAANGDTLRFLLQNGKFLSTLYEAAKEEQFQGDGGQQQSFEAEFGSLGANGKPRLLFERATGKIDPAVVNEWKQYDMGLFIQNDWSRLSKDLQGNKVHVFAGAEDNFLLNKAVEAFAEKAKKVGADVTAEIVPGANHFTVWTSPGFLERMHKDMDQKISQ
jgi:S-formylglutathione hydrolase FrmB